MTIDEVVSSDPEFIAVICCGFGLEENIEYARRLYSIPELQNMRAIRSNQVWAFDANSFFSRPTLRIVHGAELLHDMCYKELEQAGESRRVYS